MRDEDNKALGIGYEVEEDKLDMMTSINFSKKEKEDERWQGSSQTGGET